MDLPFNSLAFLSRKLPHAIHSLGIACFCHTCGIFNGVGVKAEQGILC